MDYEDYFQREAGQLFSQLLMQSPMADGMIFDAAAQCACYRNEGWKFHHTHVDDAYAFDICSKALNWINERFPIIRGEIGDSGIIWQKPAEISLAKDVHCPIFIYLGNTTTEEKVITCNHANLALWQPPIDPWNIKAEKTKPLTTVPAGKSSWLILTVIAAETNENNLEIDFSFPEKTSQINLSINWIDVFKITIITETSDENSANDDARLVCPANVKVCTSISTAQVPQELRNYMHVLPAGIHPFMHCADFFSSPGTAVITVPAGKTKIMCNKGFEYKAAVWEGDVFEDCNINIPLKKNINWDLYKDNWISGDTHIHWAKNWVYLGDDTDDLSIIQKACDCHVISVLTLSQFDGFQEVFTPVHHPMGLIEEHCDKNYIMAMDEEYRNSGPYGHVNLLGLKSLVTPVSTGFTKTDKAPDYPDNQYAFEKAHEQGAIAMCAHGIFSFDKVIIAKGLMDCVDQVFTSQYYQMLNCGFRIPTTVGTDSNARPMGKMRTYVLTENGLTYDNWLEGIRKGRTFVTNGPLLKFTVNGEDIGSVISVKKGEKISINAKAFCEIPLTAVEIVINGQVMLHADNPDSLNEISIEDSIEISQGGWIALRATTGTVCDWMDNVPSAHTSPIYLEVDGIAMSPIKEDVQTVIGELEYYIQELPNRAKFDTDDQMLEVQRHISEGIKIYKELIS